MIAPIVTEEDVLLEAVDNAMFSERRKEFQISIAGVEAVDAMGASTSVGGMPITITVYDNDRELLQQHHADIYHCSTLSTNHPLHVDRLTTPRSTLCIHFTLSVYCSYIWCAPTFGLLPLVK